MKRLIGIAAAICLLLTMLPLSVWAKPAFESRMPDRPVQINPREPQVLGLEKLEIEPLALPGKAEPLAEDYVSVEEGIVQMREQMMKRNNNIVIKVKSTNSDTSAVFNEILYGALAHTGEPGAGDNLQWTRGVISVGDGFDGYYSGGYCYYTLPYDVDYYTTAAQEAELDAAVDQLMDEWNYLEGKTDIEKIGTIYDYITSNVVYDYEHLSDPNYDLMFTGYAAMIDGTAVCQGYANLFYRLALEVGVDNRIVVGDGWTGSEWGAHAWNLVEVDGLYYYVDSTWDATYAQAGWPYQWYLLGSQNFGLDHVHDTMWSDFVADYPISATDYADGGSLPDPNPDPNPGTVQGYCGDDLTWTLSEDDMLTISGTGEMWDYPEDYPGWYQYMRRVKTCVVEEGVTSIGDWAFYECSALTHIELPDSLTSIGYGAFVRCSGLTMVDMGTGVEIIDEGAFSGCSSLTDVVLPESVTSIGNDAFYGCINLYSVDFGAGLTSIGDYAFGECYVLDDVMVPEGVTYLGEYAFAGCYALTNVELPDSILHIYEGTFAYDESLTTVTMGVGVADIGYGAFYECYSLTDVYYGGTEEQWGQISIDETDGYNDCLLGANIHFVTIPEIAHGDANGDSEVSGLDLVLLRQYIAEWDVSVDPTGGDANGDGEINGLDLVLMRQYLAGWNVTLGPKN